MIKYHPISLPSDPPERMVVFFYDSDSITVKSYFDKIDKVADHLFENTRCTRSTDIDPLLFCPEAEESQHIFYRNIERFELSRDTVNLLLLKAQSPSQATVTREIIGGPLDDYIINAHDNIPLMAQMGKGANGVYSGSAHDSHSLILDEHKNIIYDTGGHNLVAIMLPKGVPFSNVCIRKPLNADLYRYLIYRVKEVSIGILRKVLLEFRFGGFYYNSFVQFLFKESTGKEIVFKERQNLADWVTNCYFGQTRPPVEEFYQEFIAGKKTWVESVTPAKRLHK